MVSPMTGIFIIALMLSISHLLGWITLSRRNVWLIGFAFVMLISGIPFLFTLFGFTFVGPGMGLWGLTMLTILTYLAGIFLPPAFLFIAASLFRLWRFICRK